MISAIIGGAVAALVCLGFFFLGVCFGNNL